MCKVRGGEEGAHLRSSSSTPRRRSYSAECVELDFIHLVRKRVGYDHRQSPPQRGDDANPTAHDATPAQPLRATVLETPMAARPGACGRSDPRTRQANR